MKNSEAIEMKVISDKYKLVSFIKKKKLAFFVILTIITLIVSLVDGYLFALEISHVILLFSCILYFSLMLLIYYVRKNHDLIFRFEVDNYYLEFNQRKYQIVKMIFSQNELMVIALFNGEGSFYRFLNLPNSKNIYFYDKNEFDDFIKKFESLRKTV